MHYNHFVMQQEQLIIFFFLFHFFGGVDLLNIIMSWVENSIKISFRAAVFTLQATVKTACKTATADRRGRKKG